MRVIYFLKKTEISLFKLETGLLVAIIFSMIVIGSSAVVLRNLFGRDFPWMNEVLQMMVLLCAFIGGGMASRYNRHININLFPLYFSRNPILKRVMGGLTSLLVMVVALFLCISAYGFVKMEYEFGEFFAATGLKFWIFQLILIYVWVAVAFRYFVRFLGDITGDTLPEELEGTRAAQKD